MEFRHLGYVRAAEYMGLLQQRHAKNYREHREDRQYEAGYLDALKEMAEVQLRMIQQTLDAHPGHDTTPGPFRKGQLCLVNQPGCYCLVVARESE
jgi:hypothetical protein